MKNWQQLSTANLRTMIPQQLLQQYRNSQQVLMHPLPQSILWKMRKLWQPRMLLIPAQNWLKLWMYILQTVEKLPTPQTMVSGSPVYLHC